MTSKQRREFTAADVYFGRAQVILPILNIGIMRFAKLTSMQIEV